MEFKVFLWEIDVTHNNEKPLAQPVENEAKPVVGKYYIKGTVIDEETRQPIAEASLRFLVESEPDVEKRIRVAATDDKGKFQLEIPAGAARLSASELKPGYWLEREKHDQVVAVTTVEVPEATMEIVANRGAVWPIQLTLENGSTEPIGAVVAMMEVEDDATRTKAVNGEYCEFKVSPSASQTWLNHDGRGALTQCGKSGKLYIAVRRSRHADTNGIRLKPLLTELIVDPAFDATKVKSAAPVTGTDIVEMFDVNGAKATVRKARVTVTNGQPLLAFQLQRMELVAQEVVGRVVDSAGKPIQDVRIGAALSGSMGGGSETPDSAKTDADGRFLMSVRHPAEHGEYKEEFYLSLTFNRDDYAAFEAGDFFISKGPVKAIDAGEFTMEPGYSIPIRVIDEQDKPIAGAVIEPGGNYALRRLQIRTDAQGRGVLKCLPDGVVDVAVTSGDRGLQCGIVVSSDDAENTEIQFQLKPPRDPATPPKADTAKIEPITVGQIAPELTIALWTDGKQHSLADYRGRIIVLDFWTMSYSGCVTKIPMMRDLAAKYEPNGVVFLAIHTPEGRMDQINKLQKRFGWKTPIGIDFRTTQNDGATYQSYGVRGFPSLLVIDPQGKLAFDSLVPPTDKEAHMKDMQQATESLQIGWPLSESDMESDSQMNRLSGAMFAREIDKVIAANKK